MQIGIIGFGNFGKLMAKHLVLSGAEVFVNNHSDKTKEAESVGAKFVTLEEVCKKKIIILAMPMEALDEVLHKIKNKIKAGTVVLDVCSLKMFASESMKKILPKNVEIIGTHPLFGPNSAPNSVKGLKIVLCKVNCKDKTFDEVVKFCERLELKVIITTPEEHDKQMAASQALTHFIGQVAKEMKLKRVEMSTLTFDKLMEVIEVIKNDTPALFNNMQKMNPFAKELRERFVRESEKLNRKLNMNP